MKPYLMAGLAMVMMVVVTPVCHAVETAPAATSASPEKIILRGMLSCIFGASDTITSVSITTASGEMIPLVVDPKWNQMVKEYVQAQKKAQVKVERKGDSWHVYWIRPNVKMAPPPMPPGVEGSNFPPPPPVDGAGDMPPMPPGFGAPQPPGFGAPDMEK